LGGEIGLDANVFLCVLLPEATKTAPDNVKGSEAILQALEKADIQATTSAIVLSEIGWALLREKKTAQDVEGARYVLEEMLKQTLRIIPVKNEIAWKAAWLRSKYHSEENQLSYQDAIYLATCTTQKIEVLYTTDQHLLQTKEIVVLQPRNFEAKTSYPH
jgi:predicted nucleic acid-binding protein